MNAAGIHVFGVRHLSPAGAKHVLDFLDEINPTAVLIEGPSDARGNTSSDSGNNKPPVAILALPKNCPYERFCGLLRYIP